jgi:predicted phage tail component-like protein
MLPSNFNFAGLDAYQDLFLIVNNIKPYLAPQTEQIVQEVPALIGRYKMGNKMTYREIDLDVTLVADTPEQLKQRMHIVADALFTPTDDDGELVFEDEPDVTYIGSFTSPAQISKLDNNAQFTLVFIANDPYAYLPQIDQDIFDSVVNIPIEGTQPTPPIIDAVVKTDLPYLAVTTAQKYVAIGKSPSPDSDGSTYDPEEVMIHDYMNDLSLWETVTDGSKTFDTYNGIIDGGYTSTANSIYVDKNAIGSTTGYGSGDTWHGACIQRFLPQLCTDWRVRLRVNFIPSDPLEYGKMTATLLDQHGQRMGKLDMYDGDKAEDVDMHISIGGETDEHDIVNEGKQQLYYVHTVTNYRAIAHTKKVKHTKTKKKKVRGKWKKVKDTYYTTTTYYTYDPYYTYYTDTNSSGGNLIPAYSEYANLYGYIELQKKGNVFTASVHWLNEDLTEKSSKTWTYTDDSNHYTTPLAGIALWTAAYHERPIVNWMQWTDVEIDKFNDDQDVPPIIAHAGDEIQIDCESGIVYKNGLRFMQYVTDDSQWLVLQGGDTAQIGVAPFEDCDWSLSYRPKQL